METKYKQIPFDINRINEKGVQIITRDGRSVRIICTDLIGIKPIAAAINNGDYEYVNEYTASGKYYDGKEGEGEGDGVCRADLFLRVSKSRRMTNKELAWWLRDHPEEHREWRYEDESTVKVEFCYYTYEADEECKYDVEIRSNGGEWRKPLIED